MQLTVALSERPIDRIAITRLNVIRFLSWETTTHDVEYANIRNNFNSRALFYIDSVKTWRRESISRWRRRSNITATGARRWEARYIPDFPLPARQPSCTLYSRWQSVSSSTYILLRCAPPLRVYISSLNPPPIPLTALLSRSPGKIRISFRQTRNIHVAC